MLDYRRTKLTGGTYFSTVATFNRLPILMGGAAAWQRRFWKATLRGEEMEVKLNAMSGLE